MLTKVLGPLFIWPLQPVAGLGFRLESFRHHLKEFPNIIPAAMHLNFLALRLYKFMPLPTKQVAFFSPLLAVLLVNSTSCSCLQCGLVCVVLLNCCLATFIVEPCWILLSTISNLFPSNSVQVGPLHIIEKTKFISKQNLSAWKPSCDYIRRNELPSVYRAIK